VKRLLFSGVCLLMVLWGMTAFGAGLKIEEGVITTQIVERSPADAVQTYPATIGKLYCFIHVTGAEEDTSITQVWYLGDKEMARVSLPVRSSDWRTWSSKTILPQWSGDWRVEVLDAEGNLLQTIPFTLTAG
jgi:hypothetical protein